MADLSCDVPACARCSHDGKCLECVNQFLLSQNHDACVLPAETILVHGAAVFILLLLLFMAVSCVFQIMLINKVVLTDAFERVRRSLRSGRSSSFQKRTTKMQKLQEELEEKEANIDRLVVGYENWASSLIMDWSLPESDAIPEEETSSSVARQESCLPCCRRKQTQIEQPPRSYPWCIQVHQLDILGVGLPLFYNFHLLPGLSAVLGLLTAVYPCWKSGLRDVPEEGFAHHRAHHNSNLTSEALGAEAVDFAEALCTSIGVMYVVLLVLSLAYALFQVRFYAQFDISNTTEDDFTLHLTGLPPAFHTEKLLREEIEQAFGVQVVGVSIAYDLTNLETAREIDRMVVTVQEEWQTEFTRATFRDADSWAKHREYVRNTLQREASTLTSMMKDGRLLGSGHAFVVFREKAALDHVLRMYKGLWLDTEKRLNEEDLRKLSSRLQSPGRAHKPQMKERSYSSVRFGSLQCREGVEVLNLRELQQSGKGVAKLRTFVVAEESAPSCTTVLWYNCGVSRDTKYRRSLKALGETLLAFIMMAIVVYLPLGTFLLGPYAEAHEAPPFLTQQLQGFIFGGVNSFLGQTMWNSVAGIGFWNRDHFDAFILVLNIIVTMFNTYYFLSFCLYPVCGGFGAVDLLGELKNHTSFSVLADQYFAEKELSDTIYHTLMPGWLFSGYLVGQVMGNLAPLLQNTALVVIVFVCQCLPLPANKLLTQFLPYQPDPQESLTRLKVERIFQPKMLALAWDYAALLVMPTMCFITFFVLSRSIWRIFPVFMGWVIFVYVFHRQVTLRLSKPQQHSSTKLDNVALHLWGLPLSLLAAAWAFWCVRLNLLGNSRLLPPVAFVISLVIYWSGLHLIGVVNDTHHYGEMDIPYESIASKVQYSWFNSNPVRVLQCALLDEETLDELLGEEAVDAPVPFSYGKEFLQEKMWAQMRYA